VVFAQALTQGDEKRRRREMAMKTGKAKAAKKRKTVRRSAARPKDVPRLFRLNVEVGDLAKAEAFYAKLLGVAGRRQAGSRVYFEAGPVTLQVVDVTAHTPGTPHPAAKALYFTVRDLESAFGRAKELGCLSRENVHDAPGGGIVVRPWGERSFYAEDPWNNPLCFVEEGTVYRG
jgi:predicted enzyme related to lactoylglutathione lyase